MRTRLAPSGFGAPCRWLVALDTKSNFSPISVQTLSNVCLTRRKVQGLSSPCPKLSKVFRVPVQFKGSWTEIGHGNPGFVQTLSSKVLSEDEISDFGQSPDTGLGQTLDKDHILLPCSETSGRCSSGRFGQFCLGQLGRPLVLDLGEQWAIGTHWWQIWVT